MRRPCTLTKVYCFIDKSVLLHWDQFSCPLLVEDARVDHKNVEAVVDGPMYQRRWWQSWHVQLCCRAVVHMLPSLLPFSSYCSSFFLSFFLSFLFLLLLLMTHTAPRMPSLRRMTRRREGDVWMRCRVQRNFVAHKAFFQADASLIASHRLACLSSFSSSFSSLFSSHFKPSTPHCS